MASRWVSVNVARPHEYRLLLQPSSDFFGDLIEFVTERAGAVGDLTQGVRLLGTDSVDRASVGQCHQPGDRRALGGIEIDAVRHIWR